VRFRATRGDARLCVDYDELMLDPAKQLRRIGRSLQRTIDEAAPGIRDAVFWTSASGTRVLFHR